MLLRLLTSSDYELQLPSTIFYEMTWLPSDEKFVIHIYFFSILCTIVILFPDMRLFKTALALQYDESLYALTFTFFKAKINSFLKCLKAAVYRIETLNILIFCTYTLTLVAELPEQSRYLHENIWW